MIILGGALGGVERWYGLNHISLGMSDRGIGEEREREKRDGSPIEISCVAQGDTMVGL